MMQYLRTWCGTYWRTLTSYIVSMFLFLLLLKPVKKDFIIFFLLLYFFLKGIAVSIASPTPDIESPTASGATTSTTAPVTLKGVQLHLQLYNH